MNILRRTVKGKKKTIFIKSSWNTKSKYTTELDVKSYLDGNEVAKMSSTLDSSKSVSVRDANVHKSLERMGISSAMFKQTLKDIGSKGKTSLVGSEVIHPSQISIRQKYKSKFLGNHMGAYQEGFGLVKPERAKEMINSAKGPNGKYLGSIQAVTRVPKNINQTKRIRIRGRWLTIKRRK